MTCVKYTELLRVFKSPTRRKKYSHLFYRIGFRLDYAMVTNISKLEWFETNKKRKTFLLIPYTYFGLVRWDLLTVVILDLSFSEKPLTWTLLTTLTKVNEKIPSCLTWSLNIQPGSDTHIFVHHSVTRINYLSPPNHKKVPKMWITKCFE